MHTFTSFDQINANNNSNENNNMSLNLSSTLCASNGSSPSLFGGSFTSVSQSVTTMPTSHNEQSLVLYNPNNDITGEIYRCHLCSFSTPSKFQFNTHMNTHFDHKCPFCDYTSRTEGRLKRHIRDFHSKVPPDSWAGTRVLKSSRESGDEDASNDANETNGSGGGSGSKTRNYKCKQCDLVVTCKQEFWDHSKTHIKAEKLLTCPKCSFVTEYKHHLEYHLRNHFGSKPFKCEKCNYSCVNKSMLNSHMKSHSNIYQYRCNDCSYATKYCHSLKLHLRKYNHKPATVLNLDGTPNPYPVIDVYGTRRGPRPKKYKAEGKYPDKARKEMEQQMLSPSQSTLSHHGSQQLLPSQLFPSILGSIPSSGMPNLPISTSSSLVPNGMSMGLPFLYSRILDNNPSLASSLNHSSSPLALLPSGMPANLPSFFYNQFLDKNRSSISAPTNSHSPLSSSLTSSNMPSINFNPFLCNRSMDMDMDSNRPVSAPIDSINKDKDASSSSPIPRSQTSPSSTSFAPHLMMNLAINNSIEKQTYTKEITNNANGFVRDESHDHDDSIPLDLSSNKSASPLNNAIHLNNNHKEEVIETKYYDAMLLGEQEQLAKKRKEMIENHQQQLNQLKQSQIQQPTKQHQEQQQSRAQKRKGKACKLDVNRFYFPMYENNDVMMMNEPDEDEDEDQDQDQDQDCDKSSISSSGSINDDEDHDGLNSDIEAGSDESQMQINGNNNNCNDGMSNSLQIQEKIFNKFLVSKVTKAKMCLEEILHKLM